MSCDSVTREVTLPVDADEAWETVTDLDEWLVEDADLDLEPGSEGVVTLPGGEERHAVVEEVEPGERLTFWWWTEDVPATHVELTLVPAIGGTRVVVVESAAVLGPVAFAGVGHGGFRGAGRRAFAGAFLWSPALARLQRASALVCA